MTFIQLTVAIAECRCCLRDSSVAAIAAVLNHKSFKTNQCYRMNASAHVF